MGSPRLLVRHGTAGERSEWKGDDALRPLDERGRRQSDALVEALSRYEISRIVTSPYVRCVQTVEPIARARGLAIELDDRLGEEVPSEDAHEAVAAAPAGSLLCTHGCAIEAVFGAELRAEKGATWVLDGVAGAPTTLGYLPPPA